MLNTLDAGLCVLEVIECGSKWVGNIRRREMDGWSVLAGIENCRCVVVTFLIDRRNFKSYTVQDFSFSPPKHVASFSLFTAFKAIISWLIIHLGQSKYSKLFYYPTDNKSRKFATSYDCLSRKGCHTYQS